jgi:uncharacterized BrkB/YihY/UPF0761 family membrane protein
VRGAVDFGQRCFARFVSMDGFDRAMALAAQAFTALFPLLIVVAAAAESGDSKSLGAQVVARFNLTGAAADSVRPTFPTVGTITDGITAIGAVILVISALSFARALQRLYERAWLLEARGVRDTPWSLLWLFGISLYALSATCCCTATSATKRGLWRRSPPASRSGRSRPTSSSRAACPGACSSPRQCSPRSG